MYQDMWIPFVGKELYCATEGKNTQSLHCCGKKIHNIVSYVPRKVFAEGRLKMLDHRSSLLLLSEQGI